MQQVAACVKAVYQLVGQCKVTKEDCDNLLEKIDSISSPLQAMSGSSNLSQVCSEWTPLATSGQHPIANCAIPARMSRRAWIAS